LAAGKSVKAPKEAVRAAKKSAAKAKTARKPRR
jgi:hypothetical protein